MAGVKDEDKRIKYQVIWLNEKIHYDLVQNTYYIFKLIIVVLVAFSYFYVFISILLLLMVSLLQMSSSLHSKISMYSNLDIQLATDIE